MKKIAVFFNICFIIYGSAFCQDDIKWRDSKSTHFIVYYKNAPEIFINEVISKSEDYYNNIAQDLGFNRYNFWLWENRAKIYIYDDAKDYQSLTGQPNWSAGCARAQEKIIQTFPYAQGFYETVLAHEMGHIIFREFVGFNNTAVTNWLDEGVASHQEKFKYSGANVMLKKAIENGKFMNLEQLSDFNIRSATDSYLVALFYSESFSIVDFLIKDFGRDKFVFFCQNLRDKKDLARAIASVYSFESLKELDVAWQKYLNK